MTEQNFKVAVVVRTLTNEVHLVEPLLFPEVSCLGNQLAKLESGLSRHVKEILSKEPLGSIHRRRDGGAAEVSEIDIDLEPPPRGEAEARGVDRDATPREGWTRPVRLRFHVIQWQHGDHDHIAFVPALGIEVIAPTQAELAERLPQHIRFALMRSGAVKSLRKLIALQQTEQLELRTVALPVTIKSPKRVAIDEAKEGETEKPVIEEVGEDWSKQSLPQAWELDGIVGQIAEAIGGRHPRSVLLVGKSGVGKTAAVRELVRRRRDFQLVQTPFWATSGSRLVAGMSGFGMWQERCQRLCREASKARAVLFLGSLIELMEVGKSTHSAQGIASFLRAHLGRGEFLAITECTPEQLAVIERTDPHLLEIFHQIKLEEPAPEVAKIILLNYVLASARRSQSPMNEDGLLAVEHLHRRYATYSAIPARPLRFVRNLLQDRNAARFKARESATPELEPLGRGDVIAAFSRETGLPLFMLDESIPLDLPATRQWFVSRVIGQGGAVDLVVDLIATVKAALNRPRRPIASLLFIGPTGVGKTEMAKSLAEFFFGDKERMARFDMSEYATPAAVERLVGGISGSEGLLTAKVREQPFSVILLDEFEKAHPALFDLMLQVLGEGRLTDAAGRLADFANAIVIMTSNLGAASFQQEPFGLGPRGGDPKVSLKNSHAHFIDAVRSFLRPEMFNRIDRVVPFAPLGEDVVLQIARRELELVRCRDGVRLRHVDLQLPNEVVFYLAAVGFDARYGARPLKRAIERELLVPLAEGINRYADEAKLVATVALDRGSLRITVRAAVDESGSQLQSGPHGTPMATAAMEWAVLRRSLQSLKRSAVVVSLENQIYTLRRAQERMAAREAERIKAKAAAAGRKVKNPFVRIDDDDRLVRLPRLVPVAEALESLLGRVLNAEKEALVELYGSAKDGVAARAAALMAELEVARRDWDALLLSIYSLRYAKPDQVIVAVYGRPPRLLFELARAYHSAAVAAGHRADVAWLAFNDKREWIRKQVDAPDTFLADPRDDIAGLLISIHGPHVQARFAPEHGVHTFREDGKDIARLTVDTTDVAWANYVPPDGAERRSASTKIADRRVYELDKGIAGDMAMCEEFRWTGRQWAEVVMRAMDELLFDSTRSLVDD